MMMGIGLIGLILVVLFWGAIGAGAVYLVRSLFPTGFGSQSSNLNSEQNYNARDVLDQRYARGEIDRESYELMKQDLNE